MCHLALQRPCRLLPSYTNHSVLTVCNHSEISLLSVNISLAFMQIPLKCSSVILSVWSRSLSMHLLERLTWSTPFQMTIFSHLSICWCHLLAFAVCWREGGEGGGECVTAGISWVTERAPGSVWKCDCRKRIINSAIPQQFPSKGNLLWM